MDDELLALRMAAQGLGRGFEGPQPAVRSLVAVQAQDYPGAAWALGLRVPGLLRQHVDDLLDAGALLRTHVLRPTWHLVLPEDAGWLLDLTGPRILSGVAARHRALEIDPPTIQRALVTFERTLAGGGHATRPELAVALTTAGIPVDSHRLTHLLLAAELKGHLVSGRRRAGRQTYALMAERVPPRAPISREEAVARLALRYFRGHGPAQARDFAWWSGLNLGDARAGVAAAGSALSRLEYAGREHWLATEARTAPTPPVHLLPNWDEYTVAYSDRSALVDPAVPLDLGTFAFGSLLSNTVTVGGRVHGTWARRVRRGEVEVRLTLARPLDATGGAGLAAMVARYGEFHGERASPVAG